MTNYNERLDEILDYYADEHRNHAYEFDNKEMSQNEYLKSMRSDKGKAKQAIASLIKELVAEAKPEVKEVEKQIPGDMDSFLHNQEAIWSEQYVTEFEQNLLKALETQE